MKSYVLPIAFLRGLVDYYWHYDSDPSQNITGFFFACGQIGAVGGLSYPNQCVCEDTNVCTNCYRWWDAVALEAVANFGIYSNNKSQAYIADRIWGSSPYNADWNATANPIFVDDFTWYGMAYLRVYKWLGDQKWLNRSLELFHYNWEIGWDPKCGGIWWHSNQNQFKDMITIVQIFEFAADLANEFPEEKIFLERAEKVLNWMDSFPNKLLVSNGLLSTGVNPEFCCNYTSAENPCMSSQIQGMSYNQGIYLHALGLMYKATNMSKYKIRAEAFGKAILAYYRTSEGGFRDEARSYQTFLSVCQVNSDPGGDWYSFSGIFMNHVSRFAILMRFDLPDLSTELQNFIVTASNLAWQRSRVVKPFPQDGCDGNYETARAVNSSAPKFHWWWTKDSPKQALPSDPRYWFLKQQMTCSGKSMEEFTGISEVACQHKCASESKCAKYTMNHFSLECKLWSYNRTYFCNTSDYDSNFGVKRPNAHLSCSGHCGKTSGLHMGNEECFCDSECVQRMDCCLDYSLECNIPDPSCNGHCDALTPLPVHGGGYCWCDYTCNGWYTDNNSDSSCCPDEKSICEGIRYPTCFDARSQGSALNLFVAQTLVELNLKQNRLILKRI